MAKMKGRTLGLASASGQLKLAICVHHEVLVRCPRQLVKLHFAYPPRARQRLAPIKTIAAPHQTTLVSEALQ